MNKIKIFLSSLIALGLLLFAPSCTDLEKPPKSELAADQYEPTEEELPELLGAIYVPLRSMMMGWQGYFDVMEEPADIVVTPVRPHGWYDGGTYHRMHRHEWDFTQWQPTNAWNQLWHIINTANRVIFQIETDDIPLEGDVRSLALAELRGVRAWAYYTLMDSHGNVPIETDFDTDELPEQYDREEVFEFVVEELLEVIPDLSEDVSGDTYGRFTKWVGHATLARVYLNAEVYTGTSHWDEVIEQCDEIINSGEFILESDYKTNFITENEVSDEIIWSVPYDDSQATEWNQHMKTLAPQHQYALNMEAQPWGGSCGVPQFIDTYHEDDTRKEDSWFMGDFYHHDTGEYLFTYDNYLPGIGGEHSDDATMFNGYRLGKYEVREGARWALSNDFVLFRYADVLMMKAEALLRTGNAEQAAQLVTEVRERAFEDNPDAAVVTGAELQEGSSYNYGWYEDGEVVSPEGGDDIEYGRFLDELGWEFAQEARRRQDLIRFDVFHTKTWLNSDPTSIEKTIFPIPENAMLTNPNLEQNPGY